MRNIIKLLIIALIPAILVLGLLSFKNRHYDLVSILIALLSCFIFYLRYEVRKPSARELVLVTVLVAFSVVSRIAFFATPGFKPVAAITIIVGVAFGWELGFMVGSLNAVLSNIYFGQGPWTPFQMFALGIIGLVAGLLFYRKKISNKKMFFRFSLIVIYGALSGLFYSLFLDLYTVLFIDKTFNLSRYLAIIGISLPFTITYVLSNIIFLLVLTIPLMQIFERIKLKYGLYL